MKKLLIVDDEPLIVKGLRYALEQEDYSIVTAYDGKEALEMFEKENPDLILLDVMLPRVDGLEVCRIIRETSEVPIIMLTAKGEDMDKIMGLEYGADDYISKPFNVLEVKARIKSLFRRITAVQLQGEMTSYKDIKVDVQKRYVTVKGEPVQLTAKEFDILYLLMSHPGVVYKREELLSTIWNNEFAGDARTVDVHIRRLRKKLEENPDEPEYIFTRWGVGYFFAEK